MISLTTSTAPKSILKHQDQWWFSYHQKWFKVNLFFTVDVVLDMLDMKLLQSTELRCTRNIVKLAGKCQTKSTSYFSQNPDASSDYQTNSADHEMLGLTYRIHVWAKTLLTRIKRGLNFSLRLDLLHVHPHFVYLNSKRLCRVCAYAQARLSLRWLYIR